MLGCMVVVGGQYDVVHVNCDLEEASPQGGGWLVADMDNERMLLFKEVGKYVSP